MNDAWKETLNEPKQTSIGLRNSSHLAFTLGQLPEDQAFAAAALAAAKMAEDDDQRKSSLGFRGNAAHGLGEIAAARADFSAATQLEGEPLYSFLGSQHSRHVLAQGDSQAALAEAESGLLHASTCGYGLLHIELLIVLARIRLALPDAPGAIQAAREALDRAAHPDCRYAWGEADAAQA